MSIIIFLIILAVLVLVHEFGHFITAKRAGIRVDEFGLGFPPKVLTLWKKGETKYTLNLIPFGGFVKIFGETPDEESINGEDRNRSFVNKSKPVQVAVLAAGVTFNIIFAWILISAGFMFGMPAPVDYSDKVNVENARLLITGISPGSPAHLAGLKSGDEIVSIEAGESKLENLAPEGVKDFIFKHGDEDLTLGFRRGEENRSISITPSEGIVSGQKAIGVSMDTIGVLKLPIYSALWEGAKTTYALTKATVVSLSMFVYQAFTGSASLSQVSGPVGIVGIVGDVRVLGFVYLISFTALISINLAVINLIPFPALDGGRIFFVLIEALKGSPIKPKVANVFNSVGFALLILLMLAVTFNDITNLMKG